MNYILFLKAFQEKYAGITDKPLLYNYLREELQCLILAVIFTKMHQPIYFMGDTQLRLSYHINRFSEDIDFALEKPDTQFSADVLLGAIQSAFSEKVTGFKLRTHLNTRRNVVKIMVSFVDVLFNLKLSPLQTETLKIKLEIDINPPGHATYTRQQYRSLSQDYQVNVHDLATGFAGKLGAVLGREYQKGRDYYDLQWYLQKAPPITLNLNYFNANALQMKQPTYKTTSDLLKAVIDKVNHVDLTLLKQELQRFVVMDPDSFASWLKAYPTNTVSLLTTYLKQHEG